MIFNNKDTNGSAELKGLIGFIYKSIIFDNLASYIGFAERDIRKIIGKAVFEVAEDHYLSDNYQYEGEGEVRAEWIILDELVAKIQYPVAIGAYRRYVPSNDVTHSNKGRQIFVSEEEKPAFEWMINKDNENLSALYHEAVDVLLEFLDENIDTTYLAGEEGEEEDTILIPWGTSKEYEASKQIMVPNVEEFEKVFLIGRSRMTYLALVPFMRIIQQNEIRAVITPDRYDEILEQLLDKDVSEGNQLILDKICPPLVLLSLSMAVKRLSSEILPAGIFTNIVTNVVAGKTPAPKSERNELSASLQKDGMAELAKLQEHIRRLDLVTAGEEYTVIAPEDRIDPDLKFVRL